MKSIVKNVAIATIAGLVVSGTVYASTQKTLPTNQPAKSVAQKSNQKQSTQDISKLNPPYKMRTFPDEQKQDVAQSNTTTKSSTSTNIQPFTQQPSQQTITTQGTITTQDATGSITLPAPPIADYNKIERRDVENFLANITQQNPAMTKDEKKMYYQQWLESAGYPADIVKKLLDDIMSYQNY